MADMTNCNQDCQTGPSIKVPSWYKNGEAMTLVPQYSLSGICPEIDGVLKDTFGCVIYQEQVMKLVQVVFGMSLGEADMVRRAIGKKDPELMKKMIVEMSQRECICDKRFVPHILETIEKCSGYLFNKSHSAAYSYTAYQTAYLKTYYPLQFYAALLNSNIDQDKALEFTREAMDKSHIKISWPNIVESETGWRVKGDSLIAGFKMIKGVANAKFIKPNTDDIMGFKEFVERNPKLNKKVTESLVGAHCFPSVGFQWAIEYVDWFKKANSRKEEIKSRLDKFKDNPAKVEEWTKKLQEIPSAPAEYKTPLIEVIQKEKELLGFSVSNEFQLYDLRVCELCGADAMIVDDIRMFKSKKDKPTIIINGNIRNRSISRAIFTVRVTGEEADMQLEAWRQKYGWIKKGSVIILKEAKWTRFLSGAPLTGAIFIEDISEAKQINGHD